VPNVVGLAQADAQQAITDAGLVVGQVTQQYDPTAPVDQVVDQDPDAGTSLTVAQW